VELERRPPTRFRRRLVAAFLLVAAASAGLVAVLAVVLAREYRWRNFRQQALDEARVALALAPRELDAESFERLRVEYEERSEADIVAATGGAVFSSSALGAGDVPDELRAAPDDDFGTTTEDVGGRTVLVVRGTRDDDRYWFFFSAEQVQESVNEFARVCAVAWVATTVLAGLVGRSVATATLRPVRDVARAAEAIADGEDETRLPTADDEFGAVARSFNRMADEVQRRMDQLAQAAARERRFTTDIAHDLRTPLTGMAASASMLADQFDALPEAARRPAELLVADADRLRTLVLELLELSRLDAGVDEIDLRELAIRPAVAAAARSLGSAIALELEVRVDDDVSVLADPRRLARILANLLTNVATHGGGRAEVHADRHDGAVVVVFDDDGPGIPANEIATVFDRFAKSDRSRASGGSGLGLAIARAHALAMGGDITATTAPGGGARFALRLPAAPG
jgi:two-component system sensor histidine kinase MtrB